MDTERAIRDFAHKWDGHGYEKGETQLFWLGLLRALGADKPEEVIRFELPVKIRNTKFIDAQIPASDVLIEQKSQDVPLDKASRQSDGVFRTPFEQAHHYLLGIGVDALPRWIVTCNFQEFHIHDMRSPQAPPLKLKLSDLPEHRHVLDFLVDCNVNAISEEKRFALDEHNRTEHAKEAGAIVRRLYDALLRQYHDPEAPATLQSLNKLCVRLVFCLYAEDGEVFPKHNQFSDYLRVLPAEDVRDALLALFKVLDTPEAKRDPYLKPALRDFPYVNGGLFTRDDMEIPLFTDELKRLLVEEAADGFDWSGVSPTVFGAIFESTLNPETRREHGMDYTSITNIHKVIDPLFLDDLKAELRRLLSYQETATQRISRLASFRRKLASLRFLDPACGSGNFLTETYLSLRRLENEAMLAIPAVDRRQNLMEVDTIRVHLQQFYGIEINDFAVSVAKTALWISELQMKRETDNLMSNSSPKLPLRANPGIVCGNALAMDWEALVSKDPKKEQFIYIIGNPPFIGARNQTKEQKAELVAVFGEDWKNVGNLDYVACWYKKAADYLRGTAFRAALVSTNSICQGGQVADLWRPLVETHGVHLDFAHRTFQWDSESADKAHVHCVIVGFSCAPSPAKPVLFDGGARRVCAHLSPYLIDAPDYFIPSRQHPISDVPEIGMGNQPIDGGNYLFTDDEKAEFLRSEPAAARFFRPWYGSEEFINRRPRWCLWLGDATPAELRAMPKCLERVANVRALRLASKRTSTRKLADKPTRFQTENMPRGDSILLPKVSSEKRLYMPIGFMGAEVLCSDLVFLMPDASLYHFGVLSSVVHNAWMRAVCGRLKSDYRYSKDIVYNNYPWPEATEEQRTAIAAAAQAILDARAAYPDSSLADLYDPLAMPAALQEAHKRNDRAVLKAYGFPANLPEPEIVARLFALHAAKA